MRILAATDQWFPDLQGGLARVATETARHLAGRGHEITVIAPRHPGEPEEEREDGLTLLRVLPRNRLPQTLSDVFYAARHARRLRGVPFDVVLAHHPAAAVGVSAALRSTPLVFVYHASIPRELRFLRSRLRWGTRRVRTYWVEGPLALFERTTVRRAAAILALSDFSRSLVSEDHPEVASRVVRVRGGVDIAAFSPAGDPARTRERLGVPTGVPLLFTVRRLEARMGLETLLHAVRLLLDSRPVALAIAGRGSLEAELRRVAADLGLDGHVRFLGRVPDPELHELYRAADVFVLPTLAYEGFGMVTVEALASGTPVVGTPVGATPEILRQLEPRLVAESTEPASLAAAITRTLDLTGPDFRGRCRDYASEQFAWEKTMPAWENALQEVAGRPRAALAVPSSPPSGVPEILGNP